MKINRLLLSAGLVSALLNCAPHARADTCGPVTDGGGDNQAVLLHDVQTGTDEDGDWISFVFDRAIKHDPLGGVMYWQVPEFTVSPSGPSQYVVNFHGAMANSDSTLDRPYTGSRDIGTDASYPILGRARQLKGDGGSVIWAVNLKTDRCPEVDVKNIPPRVVLSFPH